MSYVLGLDLGTTTVKVVLVEIETKNIIRQMSIQHEADIEGKTGVQCPTKILQTAANAVSSLVLTDGNEKIVKIAVCGQMHGCVMWNSSEISFDLFSMRHKSETISTLITWMDQRCDDVFIRSLPKSCNRVHSGYGCASLFWLMKEGKLNINWNCAGTIQDLLVTVLCDLEKPLTSAQNAASWGYFDISQNCWQSEILSSVNFPTQMLPKVAVAGKIAGSLVREWCGIAAGTPIMTAFGDLQATVYSQLKPNSAILNIGTSSQLCFSLSNDQIPDTDLDSVDVFPYMENTRLQVAASLNGGNVLTLFVKTLANWICQITGENISSETVWSQVQSLLQRNYEERLCQINIKPTIYGERHLPNLTASVTGITSTNITDLTQILHGLAYGVINNLNEMLPKERLVHHHINNIILVGQGTKSWFMKPANDIYSHLFTVSCGEIEQNAAYGTALMAIYYLK